MDCFDTVMLISVINLFFLEFIEILDNISNTFFVINALKSDSTLLSNSIEFVLHLLFFCVKKHNPVEKILVPLFSKNALSDFVNSILELD